MKYQGEVAIHTYILIRSDNNAIKEKSRKLRKKMDSYAPIYKIKLQAKQKQASHSLKRGARSKNFYRSQKLAHMAILLTRF